MGRNTLRLDLSGFDELLTELDRLGGDLEAVVEEALRFAAESVSEDTKEAVETVKYLPAHGKYSHGDTLKSVVKHPKVEWEGTTAVAPVGFDYGEPGAGGLLITGTPKMKPNPELERIYTRKKYMKWILEGMMDNVTDAIADRLGG